MSPKWGRSGLFLESEPCILADIGVRYGTPSVSDLTVLVVSPKAQRTGAGAALLQKLVDEADAADLPCYLDSSNRKYTPHKAQDLACLCTWLVSDDVRKSTAGIGLYRKFGFVECGERPRCGPDGVITVLPMRRPAKSEAK